MLTKANELTIAKAIGHYGEDAQLIKALEEAGEYIQALAKCVNDKSGDVVLEDHLAEEVADLYITASTVCQICDIEESVEMYMDRKLRRLEQRMEE